MQFTPAGFAEVTQGIHFLHERWQIDKFGVRRKVGFNDQATCPFRGLNHFIAGQNPHPPDERVQIDQLRNLGFVADECVEIGRASCRERVSSPV